MARDYAKNRNPGRGNASRGAASRRGGSNSGGGVPGWVWLLVGLSLGLAAAAVVWIDRPAKPSPLIASTPAAAAAATGKPAPQAQIALPPKQPSKYAFYEMLPSYEVVIPREDAAASARSGKPTTPEIAAPGQYLIQVGAYKTREEADRSRASLALLGVESKIEQVTIDQTETWFRVRIGPQANLAKAQEILQRLDENGIKGMLVKVKAG
ncbi:MAG: SPOR domain-containing protein [Nevskia sp.]|nr:SPOR domain-containing protein [Nevskia sp.]